MAAAEVPEPVFHCSREPESATTFQKLLYSFSDDRQVELLTAELRIARYNIAQGRGLVKSNWDGGDSVERRARLDEISNLLREIDADTVV